MANADSTHSESVTEGSLQGDGANWKGKAQRALCWGAALLAICLVAWHRIQPDALAAITAIPPWCWWIAGLLMLLAGCRRSPRWQVALVSVVLLGTAVVCVEEVTSLARGVWHAIRGTTSEPGLVRAVTLNCNIGSPSAAAEVCELSPDIVFLQESPNESVAQEIARTMHGGEGHVLWSAGCSIIARGELMNRRNGRHFVQATLSLPGGAEIELLSVSLSSPVVRYDLWNPSCWREHAANRRLHNAELAEIAKAIREIPSDRPVLLGGDLNAPAGDGSQFVLTPRLHDAFGMAGIGWARPSSIPSQCFDSISFGAVNKFNRWAVWSVKSKHSDHRLVVGEFRIPPN